MDGWQRLEIRKRARKASREKNGENGWDFYIPSRFLAHARCMEDAAATRVDTVCCRMILAGHIDFLILELAIGAACWPGKAL